MKRYLHRPLFCLMALLLALSARAYDFKVEGLYYNVTAPGEVELTSDNESGIGYSRRVHVPAAIVVAGEQYQVMAIGDGAFMNCSRLLYVNIEEGVRRIGDCAFGWCSNLHTVKLPAEAYERYKAAEEWGSVPQVQPQQ